MAPTFYATVDADSCRPQWMPQASYLLPASSFARKDMRTPRLPDGCDVAADWGGFVASKLRGGDVGFSEAQYVEWLRRIPDLRWAALWDLPCEPSITETQGSVRLRQLWTREHAREMVEAQWTSGDTWAWVPTVQGFDVEDYVQAVEDMRPLISELDRSYQDMATTDYEDSEGDNPWEHCARSFRVGIGSLCARKDERQIWRIVSEVTRRLPGIPLHLWGVKVNALRNWPGGIPRNIVSTDSAAWNGRFKSDIDKCNAEQRALGMSQRQYGYAVKLPRYLESFQRAVTRGDWD